MPEASC